MLLRGIDVDDEVHCVDVHTSRSHIGGDQGPNPAAGPTGERLAASRLGHTAMHGQSRDAEISQGIGRSFGRKPVLHKEDRPLRRIAEVSEILELRRSCRTNGQMRSPTHDGFVVVVFAGDRVRDRVVHVLLDQVLHVAIEGRREQQDLTLFGDRVEQPRDLRGEAHVGHAVSFVDDDEVRLLKAHLVAVDQVGQSARRGHSDVNSASEILYLAHHAGTAVKSGNPSALGPGERRQRTRHLLRKLAGRNEDQRGWHSTVGLLHQLHNSETVGQGFARPGRRFAAQVATAERIGDGDGLDGKRGVDAFLGKDIYKARREAERSKCVHSIRFFLRGRLASINPEVCRRLPRAARRK